MNRETGADSAQALPRHVGPYRLDSHLGAGGMGEVYRAWDERLERWVAIKQILASGTEDSQARQRLRREARTVASLSHPAIVQIHDILESEPGDWIVMELVEGQSLHAMLLDGPLQISQALYLAVEIADGLAEAHSKGVVHRDLKTENIMVTPAGHAKILDFGLAKRLWPDDTEASLSIQGTILGTGRAMSPEQVLGEEIDHRSDLFSFGTLLFEMTTGERPFVGSSLVLTLAQVCSEDHPPAVEINPDMPEELSDLIDHLLAKEPDRRPQSAREVAAMLSAIAGIPLPERGSAAEARRYAGEPTPTQIAALQPRRPASRVSPMGGRSPSRASGTGSQDSTDSSAGIFIKTLLKTDLVDLDGIRSELGDSAAFDLFSRHDRMIRDLMSRYEGLEVERTIGGFLLLFERPLDAVHFGIEYHDHLGLLAEVSEVELEGRVAIHLGEVILRENAEADVIRGAKPLEVEGPARRTAERLALLGRPGQTLVSQEATHIARRGVDGRVEADPAAEISDWIDHGLYSFVDDAETLQVFEAVGKDRTPHAAPDNRMVAHRLSETGGRRGVSSGPLLALAILVLVVTLGVGGWWSQNRAGRVADTGRPTVAVLGFQNLGKSEDAWMATSLAEVLNGHLQVGSSLRVVARESVARAQMELGLAAAETLAEDTLAAIRRNLGSDYLVLGSLVVVPQGEDKLLSLQLYLQDTQQLETVSSWSFEGRSSELIELGTRAGQAVREHLGKDAGPPSGELAMSQTQPEDTGAAARYYEGVDALRRFDASTARRALERSIELEPDFPLAHAALAQTWRYLGFDTRAQESATRAWELAGELPRSEALWIEGHYHEARGDWDAAVKAFQGLRSFFPENFEYGLLLADAQTGAGRGQDALETLAELRQLGEPESSDPRLDLAEAEAALALGDPAGAIEAAREAAIEAEERETWLLLAEARRLEGVSLFHQGRYDDARLSYAEAERLFSEVEDVGKAAQVQTNIANLLVNEGRLDEAEELYLRAMARHREIGSRKWLADVQNGLAYVMQARGELSRANELLTETLRLVREAGDAQRETIYLDSLIWVLLQRGQWEEARRRTIENLELSQEIGAREREAWAYFYLGRVAFWQGDLADAQTHYGHALAIGEAIDDEGLAGYALRGQAEVLMYRGLLSDAEMLLQDTRVGGRVFGENTEASTQQIRARLALELGRPEEAADLADRAYRELLADHRNDEAASAGTLLVRALLAQGRVAEARNRLSDIDPWADESLNPQVRLEHQLVEATLVMTEGDTSAALVTIQRAIAGAERYEMVPLAFEARLARESFRPPGEAMLARRGLELLQREAESKGLGLIQSRAAERLDALR